MLHLLRAITGRFTTRATRIFAPPPMSLRGLAVAGALGTVLVGFPAIGGAAEPTTRTVLLDETVGAVRFLALKAEKPAADSPVVAPAVAERNILAALDMLRSRSPASAADLARLQAAGDVIVVYDPDFPDKEYASVTIAAFVADLFVPATDRMAFPVVVGRFGMHWPTADLAGVLAHELVGHGIQHLEGRLTKTRSLDLECEAWLHQEQAHQDLGIDKFRPDMIAFRRQLETIWCADLRDWQRDAEPDS